MRSPIVVFVALIVVLASLSSSASDLKWWATSAPYQATNGQITLTNASGTTRTLQTNPTGAYVSTRTANTQAPTVVVQATASIPIKAVGAPCVTSNSSDNLYAQENHAITSDRTSLLTCQSGVWTKSGSGGDHGTFLTTGNYLCGLPFVCASGNPKTGTCSCPAGTSAYQTSFGWTGDWACVNTQTRGYACH